MTLPVTASESSQPFVSVVVAARDDETEIEPCLASLERLAYPRDCHEIIVVDNGSSDGTLEILRRQHTVRIVSEPREGIAYARNAGIAAARGDIVAFTDPDCRVSTQWLEVLAREFADQRVVVVAGAIVPYPPSTDVERYAARRLSHSQLRPLGHHERPFGMTPNLSFRREALEQVGMFDTCFPGGGWEDADICWRLARMTGVSPRYAPRAIVFHHYRSTRRDFLRQHYRYGYGLGLILKKYEGELPRSWRLRAGSYSDVAVSLRNAARTSIDRATGGNGNLDQAESQLDLLRVLGQRAGFLHASLVARARLRRGSR